MCAMRDRLVALKVGSSVNDLDAGELFQLDEAAAAAAAKESGGLGPAVRAATVDNYQGEESDIILISLVRSNPQGDIGFLSSAQRVNVLLSRARNGMFIFGNMDCLASCRAAHGRDLWQRLRGLLAAKGQLMDFLPLVCRQHGTVAQVRDAADFDRLCPNGGCTLPCDSVLPCGHACPLSCHQARGNAATAHGRIRCTHLVPDVCPYGHALHRECGGSVKCLTHVRWKCAHGHTLSGDCHSGRPMRCHVCCALEAEEAKAAARKRKEVRLLQEREAKLAGAKRRLENILALEAGKKRMKALAREEALVGARLAELRDTAWPVDASGEEGDLAAVLERYRQKGALQADNLLDTLLPAEPSLQLQQHPEAAGLRAMRFILQSELDPQGSLRWEQPDPLMEGTASASVPPLQQAVWHWASFLLSSRRQLTMHAGEHAARLSRIARFGASLQLPAAWLEQAQAAASSVPGAAPPTVQIAAGSGGAPTQAAAGSASREAWESVLAKDPEAPVAMSAVMAMVGLEAVKSELVSQYRRVKLARQQGDGAASSYNARLDGNPGTGKTTVARHYAAFLRQLRVLPEGSLFVETSGAGLSNQGIPHLQKELDKMRAAGGGVVLVDEAYQLASDPAGRKVLDYILPLAEGLEGKYGRLVWLFAGYAKDMERLFEHNPGLPSRFPVRLRFEDYSDPELLRIFHGLMEMRATAAPAAQRGAATPASGGSSAGGQRVSMPRGGAGAAWQMERRAVGTTAADRFLSVWTWRGGAWTDRFGNVTGYGPRPDLGTESNPVVSASGQRWTYADGEWTAEGATPQEHYPGSPAPAAPTPAPEAAIPRDIPFACASEKDLRIAVRRLGRGRGRPGFGNARAVRTLFEQVRSRQAQRLGGEGASGADIFLFTQDDLLGPPPAASRLRRTETYRTLSGLEGLQPVKDQVEQLIDLVDRNWHRELREEPPLEVVLNRVFLGNPGTGKTTVAALYGKLLGEMGLLSKGDVVLKTPSDFVGEVLGSSEKATRGILKSAEGCDEAYSLYAGGSSGSGSNDMFKTAIVDTLVEQVQAGAGDDRAVVLLGYEEEMRAIMRNVNPGLSRRFQLENAFVFPDFSDESLLRILLAKVKAAGLEVNLPTAKRAVASLAKARAKPNFGNAGAVENLLSTAKLRMLSRPGSDGKTLAAEDFSLGASASSADAATLAAMFSDLVGCDGVKTKLQELRDTVLFMQGRGEPLGGAVSFGWVFTGGPGTGKTTVARRMGAMFAALGLLPDCAVTEVSVSDLMTGYTGQTGRKTKEILQQSLGGVLFVDEAYQLNPQRGGAFAAEAVDELVKGLTSEEFQGKLLVILAGYKADMDAMMAANAGLQSRFPERLHFEDLSVDAAAAALTTKLGALLPVSPCAQEAAPSVAEALTKLPGFGNYRDVERLCQKAKQKVASRSKASPRGASITRADLQLALRDMQANRAPSDRVGPGVPAGTRAPTPALLPAPQQRRQSRRAPPAPPALPSQAHVAKPLEEAHVGQEEDPVDGDEARVDADGRLFGGVDPRVLAQLQSVLDAQGLHDEESMRRMAALDPADRRIRSLRRVLTQELGMDPAEAMEQLLQWQGAQKELHAEVEKQREMAATGTATQEPIWRCAVCGRDDQPWIVCWTAPYIAY
eukprot:jgi/Tetstr1/430950/TSEL_020706.t1